MHDNPTLSQVIEGFINAKKAERVSPDTIRTYETVTGLFMRFIGPDKPFKEIQTGDIRAYLGSLDHVSDKTACGYYIVISSLWTFAVSEKIIDDHIVRKIPKPRYTERQIIPFTEQEIKRILAACETARDRAIVMTLIDCGLRASELVNLRVKDWYPGQLRVMGKGRKERTVPISEATEHLILSQLILGNPDGHNKSEYLFLSVREGKPINYDGLRYLINQLGERSGVNDTHAHRFRHTFAITFLRQGGDIYTLQKILGHATLEMVKHYLNIAKSDIERQHAKASPVKTWGLGAGPIEDLKKDRYLKQRKSSYLRH